MAESTVDIRQLLDGFTRMDARASSRAASFFKEAASDLRAHVRGHDRGPDGSWPARDPESEKRTRPQGKLRTANQSKSDQSGARVISKIRWSQAHETGDVIGNRARLPARPKYWISPDFAQEAADGFLAFVLEGWTR